MGSSVGESVSLSAWLSPEDYANVEHKIRQTILTRYDIHDKVQFQEKEFYKFLITKQGN